jgi:transketolase
LAIEDFAALRAIPNLVILSPSDAVSAEKATLAAAEYAGPVILRLPAVGTAYPTLYTNDLKYEIGKALCVHEGEDVAILATGIMVNDALGVAESLKKGGIGARVLDMHTIKPLDEGAVLAAARDIGAIVTVEDANVLGGLGGAVAELTAERCPVWIKRVGIKDVFGESGTAEEIKAHCGLTPAAIQKAVQEVLNAKKGNASTKNARLLADERS